MKRILLTALLVIGSASTAHADYLGLLTGRSADPSSMSNISIDVGVTNSSNLRNLGVRGNFRVGDELTLFANLGLGELGAADGTSFGGGAYLYLPNQRIVSSLDMALKGYVQIGSLDFVDTFALQTEVLISPKQAITANGLSWYAHAGLGYFDVETQIGFLRFTDDAIEPLIGGGITLPLGPGTLFAGGELVDEFSVGVGYRFNL